MLAACSSKNDINYESLEDFRGKRIGVMTGSLYKDITDEILDKDYTPVFVNTSDEAILALKAKRLDGFTLDEVIAEKLLLVEEGMELVEYPGVTTWIGTIFSNKSLELKDEYDQYLEKIMENGVYDEYLKKWITGDSDIARKETVTPNSGKKVINLLVSTDGFPMLFYDYGGLQGFEIELFEKFCIENGYALNIDTATFDSLIPSVATNKYDAAMGCINYSEERADSVNFSKPVLKETVKMVYVKDSRSHLGFFASMKHHFENTFIVNKRYKIILDGISVTLLITLLSLIFGTVLGYYLYLWCFVAGKRIEKMLDMLSTILSGLPSLIVLMIIYYVIFGKIDVSGLFVSVLSFTIITAADVYSMLKTGVKAIDKGQFEGALALGYTNIDALKYFVLPQAVRIIMPTYITEVISLVKSTSIVGYITVEDLTRAGDIIRSNTYDAFFPLMTCALLYFGLAMGLAKLVEKVALKILEKREKTH